MKVSVFLNHTDLLLVSPVHDVDHSFGVGVAEVAVVRRTRVHHRLVDRVRRLIREDASGEARDDLPDAELVADGEHVVVHRHVVPEKVQVGPHVVEQTANLRVRLMGESRGYQMALIMSKEYRKLTILYQGFSSTFTFAARWTTCVGLCLSKMALYKRSRYPLLSSSTIVAYQLQCPHRRVLCKGKVFLSQLYFNFGMVSRAHT